MNSMYVPHLGTRRVTVRQSGLTLREHFSSGTCRRRHYFNCQDCWQQEHVDVKSITFWWWWYDNNGEEDEDADDDDGQPVESQPSSPSYTWSGPWQEGKPQDHTPPPLRMTMITFGGFAIVQRMISIFKVVMITFGKIVISKRMISPPDLENKTLSASTESHLWKPTHT